MKILKNAGMAEIKGRHFLESTQIPRSIPHRNWYCLGSLSSKSVKCLTGETCWKSALQEVKGDYPLKGGRPQNLLAVGKLGSCWALGGTGCWRGCFVQEHKVLIMCTTPARVAQEKVRARTYCTASLIGLPVWVHTRWTKERGWGSHPDCLELPVTC